MYTLKQASMLKEKHPEDEIYVFYIDIRSTGKGFEELYTRARNAGIKFIRGKPGEIREDPDSKNLIVTVENSLAGVVEDIELDMVILSTGMLARSDAVEVGQIFHVSRSAEGFFLEKHPKLAPVDTATDGVFLAGACQGPKDIPNSVVQARGTAMASANLITAGEITLGGDIAYHLPEMCIGCGRCVKACAYGAWELVELDGQKPVTAAGKPRKKIAKLTQALCKGCGTCVAECRDGAIEMKHFTDMQIISQIDAALEEKPEEKIIALLCNWCSYGGADNAGVSRMQYPPNARVIRVMCTGRVDTKFIEHAFDKGAGMVLVAGCHEGDCHYIHGNKFMTRREKRIRRMMDEKGIAEHRFRLDWISASEGQKFQRVMQEMADVLTGKVKPPEPMKAEAAKAEANPAK
jgi:heterodisulfide reductase subunit A